MTIWMAVTTDKYELPIAVADTADELAKLVGVANRNLIYSSMCKAKKHGWKSKYIKVNIQEDEEC